MKYVLTLAAVICSILSAQAKPPATGTIIVYRTAGWGISALPFNLDHGPQMKLRNGEYIRLTVSPDQHILSHDYSWLSGTDPQTVQVAAGQTVYFVNDMHFMSPVTEFQIADDQAEAPRIVATLHCIN